MNLSRLRIIIVIIVLLLGASFFVFAFFFNKATLEVSAATPFNLNIVNVKSQVCSNSPCSITVAPGHYSLKLTQEKSLDIIDEIDLPLGQTTTKNYTFKPAPELKLTAAFKQLEFHKSQNNIHYFSDQKGEKLYFVSDSPIDSRPALYQLDANIIPEKPFDTAKTLLYFTRSIKQYLLEISPNGQKIALIDQTNPAAQTLYLLDLQNKARQALEQDQQYFGVKWLGDNSLLVQRRNLQTIQDELYYYKDLNSNQSPEMLDLVTSLDLIYPEKTDQFVYLEPFALREDGSRPDGFFLYRYTPSSKKLEQLYVIGDLPLPTQLNYDDISKTYYFLIGDNTYSLGPF